MYSKEENRQINIDFYTNLGELMKENIPLSGEKVKWANYKTGVKGVYFKVDADKRTCRLMISIKIENESIRHLMFDQFEEFKTMLENNVKEEGVWFRDFYDDFGDVSSKIEWVLDENVSKLRRDTWERMHEFLKARFIGLDEFWVDVKDVFVELNK